MGGVQEPIKYQKQQLKNTHPFFDKGWIVTEENRSYLQKSYPISEVRYQEWRSNVSKAAGYPNQEYSFLPIDLGYIPNNQIGSKDGYALVNYPSYPYLLSDQIKKRKAQNLFFKEKQLYYLLYALVAVKIDAKQRGEVVGDIKPQNVFINNQEKIKIGTLHSFPFQTKNYTKATSLSSYNILLAPEDLKLLSQKKIDNQSNLKSEVFSIGATVLSAGILSDLSEFYDFQSWQFFRENHAEKTVQWLEQENYSQIFKSIIFNLLSPDPEKRITIEELWKFLSKYQSSILAKEQFIVTNPPESLELGVSVIRSKIQN